MPFRGCIHKAFGTRNPEKLNLKGAEQEVFVIWFCSWAIYVWGKDQHGEDQVPRGDIENDDENKEIPIRGKMRHWLKSLKRRYPRTTNQPGAELRNERTSSESTQCTAHTLLPIIQAAAAKMPDSYYTDERYSSVDFLQWGWDVISEEALYLEEDGGIVLVIGTEEGEGGQA